MNNRIIAKVNGIIRREGGYREREIIRAPHEYIKGETWNDAHKVIEVLLIESEADGYRPGCAVDIVTNSIVG